MGPLVFIYSIYDIRHHQFSRIDLYSIDSITEDEGVLECILQTYPIELWPLKKSMYFDTMNYIPEYSVLVDRLDNEYQWIITWNECITDAFYGALNCKGTVVSREDVLFILGQRKYGLNLIQPLLSI